MNEIFREKKFKNKRVGSFFLSYLQNQNQFRGIFLDVTWCSALKKKFVLGKNFFTHLSSREEQWLYEFNSFELLLFFTFHFSG